MHASATALVVAAVLCMATYDSQDSQDSQVVLSDEVFLADADARQEQPERLARAILRGACVAIDANTPKYRLTYREEQGAVAHVCTWRPWRLGTFFIVDDVCECL